MACGIWRMDPLAKQTCPMRKGCNMDITYAILSNSLSFEESGVHSQTPHKLVKLLPLGLIHSTKGDFLIDNDAFQSIRCKFVDRKLQIPIDYEHQTLKDMQAPAAGWITDIILKSDGIYGAVNWTERAMEYLKNREYRYLSPVILTQGKERRAVALHSVALTNTPAIDGMEPIINSNKPSEEELPQEETETGVGKSSLEALSALLQLDPSATIEDIYNAVSALLKSQDELKLMAEACRFEVTRMKADSVVFDALKEGKLAPFQRDWAFRFAMNDLDSFTHWLKDAPQIVPMGDVFLGELPTPRRHSRVHELMGLSAEDIAKYGS